MRKLLLSLALLTFLWPSWRAAAAPEMASPGEVISAINAYRAANGLPPYQTNSILMATAQGQSDYQASIGTVTHSGPGGSTPKDRALAAGYGDGSNVFVSEIIYGGSQTSVEAAMEWWKNSSLHNSQMLASTYQEIGAGISTDGNWTYFTAVMGYVAGGAAPPANSGTSGQNGSAGSQGSTGVVIIPVVQAEPNEDGSIVHIVRTGQALWTIAAVYGVPLEDLLELNDLPEWAVIFPGDEILIRPPFTPTPSPTPITPTATITPTRTTTKFIPIGTPVSAAGNRAGGSGQPQEAPQAGGAADVQGSFDNPMVRWVVILAFASIFLVLAGSMLVPRGKERREKPEKDDVL